MGCCALPARYCSTSTRTRISKWSSATGIETKGDRVTDLHLWQVGPGHRAAVISVVSDHPLPPSTYKRRLGGLRGLSHVTVEVETCPTRALDIAAG